MELFVRSYFQRQANATWFDVPKSCHTEEECVLSVLAAFPHVLCSPVCSAFVPTFINFTSTPVANVPNNIAAVLSCANKISTCGYETRFLLEFLSLALLEQLPVRLWR